MIHSILIVGQSNMAGRGDLEQAPTLKNQDKIFVARNCRWVNLFRPVNPDRPFSGVCLAETFADLYAEEHDGNVGIIPCADGGTCIDQWMPGEVLFENAVNCAKLCQTNSTLVAILWHQGESDCTDERYPFYLEKIQIVMAEFRKRLGKNIPIVVGELGEYLSDYPKCCKHFSKINQDINEFAKKSERVALASSIGLTDKGDNLHFNTQSLTEFAKRYYKAFKSIENKNLCKNEKNHSLDMTEMEKL